MMTAPNRGTWTFWDRDRAMDRGVLKVDADLIGLPEPLVDAEHGHVAQAHQQLARARSVGLHRCSPG